jgi:hypothetical protein
LAVHTRSWAPEGSTSPATRHRQRGGELSRINNGVKELIDQILVLHLLVHALNGTESLPLEGIKSVTARPGQPVPGGIVDGTPTKASSR